VEWLCVERKIKMLKGSLKNLHLNHTHNLERKNRVANDRLAVLDDMGEIQILEEMRCLSYVLSVDIMAFFQITC
jgi:hypothetical protein